MSTPRRALEEAGLPPEPPGHVPSHGRPFPLRVGRILRKRNAMRSGSYERIFVVGASRTGTSSLGVALMELGFSYTGWHPKLVDAMRAGDLDAVDAVVCRYEAFKDPPWNIGEFYRTLDQRYPRSRFINTVRDVDTWIVSFEKTFGPQNRAALVDYYLTRNREIREYFAERPRDFLELAVVDGGGWAELTRFLGFPPRAGRLPNADAAPNSL